MKPLLYLIVLGFLIWLLVTNIQKDFQRMVKTAMEMGYKEGQVDAINGDVRIRKVDMPEGSSYIWTKSPWDEENK